MLDFFSVRTVVENVAAGTPIVKNRRIHQSHKEFDINKNQTEDYSKPMKIRIAPFLVAVVLMTSTDLPAQVKLSDTPAAHQLSGWLAAFNSGDTATFVAFLQKNYPAHTKDIDREMGFRDQTGGFDLRLANECEATKCSGILQERSSEQFARIVVEVDPAEPHVIKSIELHPIPRPAEFPIPRMTEAEALKAFRADLDGARRRRPFFRRSSRGKKWEAGLQRWLGVLFSRSAMP